MPTHTTIRNRENAANWMREDINSLYRVKESSGKGGRPCEGDWRWLTDPDELPNDVRYVCERKNDGARVYFEFRADQEEHIDSDTDDDEPGTEEEDKKESTALSTRVELVEQRLADYDEKFDRIVKRQFVLVECTNKSAQAVNTAVDAVHKSIDIFKKGVEAQREVSDDSSKSELYRGLNLAIQRFMDLGESFMIKNMTEERKKKFDKFLKLETILQDSEESIEDITPGDIAFLMSIRQDPETMELFRSIKRETHRRRMEKAATQAADTVDEK